MGFIRLLRDNGDEIALNAANIVSFEPVLGGAQTEIKTSGGVFRVRQNVSEISEALMHDDEPLTVNGLDELTGAVTRLEELLQERLPQPAETATPAPSSKKSTRG